MSITGTLKANELRAAKITVDFLANPVRVHTLFALVDTKTGKTMAWSQGEGGMWSDTTMAKLKELCEAMERDAANALLDGDVPSGTTKSTASIGGIGEHLGDGEADAPSI
jgi:hypothetical protein